MFPVWADEFAQSDGASAAQRTKRCKLPIYGNLLPLHEPLRLAEELAMLDCLSNGRLISGFARGIPREYQVHNVPLSDSRAWTEDVFSYEGKFWSYEDVAGHRTCCASRCSWACTCCCQ